MVFVGGVMWWHDIMMSGALALSTRVRIHTHTCTHSALVLSGKRALGCMDGGGGEERYEI